MENLHSFEFIKNGYQINKEHLQASSPVVFENQGNQPKILGQIYRMFQKQPDNDLESMNDSQYSINNKLLARVIKLDHIKPYKIQEILQEASFFWHILSETNQML